MRRAGPVETRTYATERDHEYLKSGGGSIFSQCADGGRLKIGFRFRAARVVVQHETLRRSEPFCGSSECRRSVVCARASDVTAAILIWLPDGVRPKSADFGRNPSAEVVPSFAEAVEHAMASAPHRHGQHPWIKVGSRVCDPKQTSGANRTLDDIAGRSPYTA